ncbi:MAG: hypothetical protein QOG97_2005 [Acidimicrobiaceae bacterium]|nr:hypothetical protein [Acidimicrobiaceae bacterium]
MGFFSGCASEPLSNVRAIGEMAHRCSKTSRITDGVQEPRYTVLNQVGRPPGIRCDDRNTHRHGFCNNHPKWLRGEGGVDYYVDIRQLSGDVFTETSELDTTCESQPVCQVVQRGFIVMFAEERRAD